MNHENMKLGNLYDAFLREAHNCYWDHEAVALRNCKDWSTELENDLAKISPEKHEAYTERFCELLCDALSKRAQCASAHVVGPANFPAKKNAARHESHRKSIAKLNAWRHGTTSKASRKETPEQEKERLTEALSHPDRRVANKVKKKLALMEKRETLESGFGEWIFGFEGEEIKRHKMFAADGRIQFLFASKPDETVRSNLKSKGFKWSPSRGTWVRKLTTNAVYSVWKIVGVEMNFFFEVQS